MAQWVKNLLYKPEDRSSAPPHPPRSQVGDRGPRGKLPYHHVADSERSPISVSQAEKMPDMGYL